MMYCSVADVRFALTQSGNATETNTAADMDDVTIQDAIAESSAVLDGYIGGPYASTDVVPPVITFWCRDIAAFLATCTWRKSKDFAAMDPVLLRYQWAMGQLTGIATGAIVVPGDGPSTGNGGSGATVVNQNSFTLFHAWDFDLLGIPGGPPSPPVQNQWWGYVG